MDRRSGWSCQQIRNSVDNINLNAVVLFGYTQSNIALSVFFVFLFLLCRDPPSHSVFRIIKTAEAVHVELNPIETGKRIKMIRSQKKFSQIAFAAELHVSREQISRWENGIKIPALDILCQISLIGRMSLDYLITGQETECREKQIVNTLLADLLEMDKKSTLWLN